MIDWTKPEPPPVKTDSAEVWPLVIASLRDRAGGLPFVPDELIDACRQRHEFGKAKYKGIGLQVLNGRNPLNDLRDEALDAVAYSRQQHERTKAPEDWDLHLDCVRLAARVVERIVRDA
jgi:hypothetical protein